MTTTRKRPRRTTDYITSADRIRLLSETNGKLIAQVQLTDSTLARSSGIVEEQKARIDLVNALLVAWVTSKRAENRHMTVEEKALFDEGMKLVPPREYVALEAKS